jgi:hypothetical protein
MGFEVAEIDTAINIGAAIQLRRLFSAGNQARLAQSPHAFFLRGERSEMKA